MSLRWIGRASFGFGDAGRRHTSLDDPSKLIDRADVDRRLERPGVLTDGAVEYAF